MDKGLAFAFGWTPCIGPILGAILTLSSTSGGMSDGIWLLSIYSAGLGVPFLLAALFTDAIAARDDGAALDRIGDEVRALCAQLPVYPGADRG